MAKFFSRGCPPIGGARNCCSKISCEINPGPPTSAFSCLLTSAQPIAAPAIMPTSAQCQRFHDSRFIQPPFGCDDLQIDLVAIIPEAQRPSQQLKASNPHF